MMLSHEAKHRGKLKLNHLYYCRVVKSLEDERTDLSVKIHDIF